MSSTTSDLSSLYARAKKVYPREVKGRYARLRKLAMFGLLGLFYGVAWLQWDGSQAVLFDLPARKFHIWGIILWPQDFIYLTLLLIIAALSLFFVTALAGRLWCGYACPQTVWTEAFVWIEQLVEGKRNKRIKMDKGPWTREKVLRKAIKQFLWVALALWTGFTFVGYFTPIRELGVKFVEWRLGHWELFWIGLYGFATYFNAGFLREQVCRYMCPYARFQSAMFDKDTLIISYDEQRGEPRGSRRRGSDYKAEGLGDCIECQACVQVCPTGIDIREGLQYECIACAACIDACNGVMDKVGYPRGLVRYTTEHATQGKTTKVIRPRVILYAGLLVVLLSSVLWGLSQRVPLIVDVIRDRNALYREVTTDDGQLRIENTYTFKILNMDNQSHRYALSVTGVDGVTLVSPRQLPEIVSGEIFSTPATISVPRDGLAGGYDLVITAQALDRPDLVVREPIRFIAPF